jgi:hypothetical protein
MASARIDTCVELDFGADAIKGTVGRSVTPQFLQKMSPTSARAPQFAHKLSAAMLRLLSSMNVYHSDTPFVLLTGAQNTVVSAIAMLCQVSAGIGSPVAVTPSDYSCAMNLPCCAI